MPSEAKVDELLKRSGDAIVDIARAFEMLPCDVMLLAQLHLEGKNLKGVVAQIEERIPPASAAPNHKPPPRPRETPEVTRGKKARPPPVGRSSEVNPSPSDGDRNQSKSLFSKG